MTLLDEFPYPWAKRVAQELHLALCELYPTSKAAMFVATKAGLDPARLFPDQPVFLLWKEILEAGSAAQRNRNVVTVARDQTPGSPRRPFFEALLSAQATPSLDAEPRSADGAPRFLIASDDVTEPEALLFRDDLTLEIGRITWMMGVLQRLRAVAPAVCLMRVRSGPAYQFGTGFRIASDLLLTNWHVLHFDDIRAAAVTAEFGYEDDGNDGWLTPTAIACDVQTIRGNQDDDWAVIRTLEPVADEIPILKLSEPGEPIANAPAFIVQHPDGQRKRVAYVRNQITSFNGRVVQYLSDTRPGSSGSPVFDEHGRLVALHHAGGRPQEVAGRPPVRKNEGIRIERVHSGLATMQIDVP